MSGGKVTQRVRLISTSKPEVGVKPGDTGVIWRVVPSNGVLRVKWDSGARLDLDPDEDEWEVID
jgi:hypothetical protein